MEFRNPYWSNKLRISTLQRWILVHSILYYEMDSSIVSDKMFDKNAYQLVGMQNKFPDEAKESDYWYVFYDFDASTGFHLYDRLTKKDKAWLTKIASIVLHQFKGGLKSEKRK